MTTDDIFECHTLDSTQSVGGRKTLSCVDAAAGLRVRNTIGANPSVRVINVYPQVVCKRQAICSRNVFLKIKLTISLRAANANLYVKDRKIIRDASATAVERAGGAALQGGHASFSVLQDVDGSIGGAWLPGNGDRDGGVASLKTRCRDRRCQEDSRQQECGKHD